MYLTSKINLPTLAPPPTQFLKSRTATGQQLSQLTPEYHDLVLIGLHINNY